MDLDEKFEELMDEVGERGLEMEASITTMADEDGDPVTGILVVGVGFYYPTKDDPDVWVAAVRNDEDEDDEENGNVSGIVTSDLYNITEIDADEVLEHILADNTDNGTLFDVDADMHENFERDHGFGDEDDSYFPD